MRKKYTAEIEIPNGINCEYADEVLKCTKGNVEISRKISIPGTDVKILEGKVKFECSKANKRDVAIIISNVSHLKNMLKGLGEKFTYKLEICNVHFPMSVKVDGNKVVISNFLGEKINRIAKILEGVEVKISGKNIDVSGSDIEKAGQTASNIEKATRISKKDRRIFQDGCFLVEKPGGII